MAEPCSKEKEISDIKERLERLDPLLELVPIIQEIANQKKAETIMAGIVMRWIAVIATIVGLIAGALAIKNNLK